MTNDVFSGLGVKIKLKEDDDFLKVKETLTRIGIESKAKKTIYQSCHILHKRGEYAIMHFKELFKLDGKQSTIDDSDIERRNTISKLLSDWGLIEVVEGELDDQNFLPVNQLKILPFKEKKNWTLSSKYTVGSRG